MLGYIISTMPIDAFGPESRKELSQIFAASEPKFSSAIGEFGVTDLVRYNYWLRASARTSSGNDQNIDSRIIENLGRQGTDPRAVLAYLISPEGTATLASAHVGSPARALLSAVGRYAAQFPSNPMIGEMNSMIVSRVAPSR